jgi:hypothetical protein
LRLFVLNEEMLKWQACQEAPIQPEAPWEVLHSASTVVLQNIDQILVTPPEQQEFAMIGDEIMRSAHWLIDLAHAMGTASRDPGIPARIKAWPGLNLEP